MVWQPLEKPLQWLRFNLTQSHERVQKRFDVSTLLLSGKRPAPIAIKPQGEKHYFSNLFAATLGDFVSIYLAILNNVNPTPVDLVESLKVELG